MHSARSLRHQAVATLHDRMTVAFSFALHVEASGSKVINSLVAIKDPVAPFDRGTLKTSQEKTACLEALNNLSVQSSKKEDREETVQEQKQCSIYTKLFLRRVYYVYLTDCPREMQQLLLNNF